MRPGRCRTLLFSILLLIFPVSAALTASTNTNTAATGPSLARPGRPFILFPLTAWYPTRPKAARSIEVLTLIFFVAVPCAAALALRAFYRKTKLQGRSGSWGHLAIGNALLLLFLLSLFLLAGELWFRFFVDTTDSLGFTKVCEHWVSRHWRTNGAGCRDNIEYAPAILSGKRRLTFVGDSFTAGHGIPDVENRFGNRLRALHPDWEVHLLANVGLDTGAEIKLLDKAFFRRYELDEVVLVYCLNDVVDLMIAPGQPYAGKLPDVEQVGPWFTRGSYFVDLFYNRYKAAQNPFVKDYFSFVKDGYRGEYWEVQKKRLNDFRALVQSHGGHLSVVTFPFMHSLGSHYDYGFAHDELNRFWSESGVPHLDLLTVYKGYSSRDLTVNPHDAHPNELANKLAADAINQVLWPSLTNRSISVH